MTICLEINGLRPELGELYVFFDGEDVTFDCFAMDVDAFDAGILRCREEPQISLDLLYQLEKERCSSNCSK